MVNKMHGFIKYDAFYFPNVLIETSVNIDHWPFTIHLVQKRAIDKTKGKEAVKPDEFEYITVKIFLFCFSSAGIFKEHRLTIKQTRLSETELIKNLQAGSESSFRELVVSYQDRVYNTVLGFVQQTEEAEDLTQEVFIKIYQSIKTFRQDASLGTWIYRIAVTKSLDHLRQQKRKKRGGTWLSIFGGSEEPEAPDFIHPGVVAEQKENSVMLFKAINNLPDNQKAAFLLQKLEGLGQDEIAAVLKTSVSSVESLLHRAKQNLRKILNDHYKGHE